MNPPSRAQDTRRVIGIVAASGGLEAIREILSGLPRDFAAPVLVVQSMMDRYLDPFVASLAEKCPIPVAAAEDGQVPEPGKVYVAAADGARNLLIEQGILRLVEREARVFDSKDALFRSMAREFGARAIAVILTGLGSDGPAGMQAVRDVGGYTIAQDETTSVVYWMPRVAVELDAACESLPIGEIAARLVALVAPGHPRPN